MKKLRKIIKNPIRLTIILLVTVAVIIQLLKQNSSTLKIPTYNGQVVDLSTLSDEPLLDTINNLELNTVISLPWQADYNKSIWLGNGNERRIFVAGKFAGLKKYVLVEALKSEGNQDPNFLLQSLKDGLLNDHFLKIVRLPKEKADLDEKGANLDENKAAEGLDKKTQQIDIMQRRFKNQSDIEIDTDYLFSLVAYSNKSDAYLNFNKSNLPIFIGLGISFAALFILFFIYTLVCYFRSLNLALRYKNRGASLIEMVLLISLIGVITITSLQSTGEAVNCVFENVADDVAATGADSSFLISSDCCKPPDLYLIFVDMGSEPPTFTASCHYDLD